jgi:hypothetical protein
MIGSPGLLDHIRLSGPGGPQNERLLDWTDVGAAPRDGEDHAFITENLDGTKDSIPADVVLLLELLHGRQRAVPPLTRGDPRSQDGSQLLVGRFRCPVINGHMIKLDHQRSDLITWYICSVLFCSVLLCSSLYWR